MKVSNEILSQYGFINAESYDYSDYHAMVIGEKMNAGTVYLDARKWIQFGRDAEPHPSKRGLMLKKSEWPRVLKAVEKLLKNESA